MEARLAAIAEADQLQAAREWQALGILPSGEVSSDEQVGAVWTNPLFCAFMDTLGFTPPEDCDLPAALPPRVSSFEELATRRDQLYGELLAGSMARGEADYWKVCLSLQAPELYLEPYLVPGSWVTRGCDLACGWGRACLTLPSYARRSIAACDLSMGNLDRLDGLIRRQRLSHAVTPVQVDITRLPFASDSFHFFLAFDIFEHLTDEALERTLRGILHCGRRHAVVYTEIPLQALCRPLTHIQNFTPEAIVDRFLSICHDGKQFRLLVYHPEVADHFSFAIVPAGD